MKKKQKPTREQKKLLIREGQTPSDWFVERDTSEKTVFVNRHDDQLLFVVCKESGYEIT